MRILLAAKRRSDIATKWRSDIATKWRKVVAMGVSLIFTHISEHARLEIPMDLGDLRAFSPPRPASGRATVLVKGKCRFKKM